MEDVARNDNTHKRFSNKSYWEEAKKIPNEKEKKVLVAETLAVLLRAIMNYQVYSFNGKYYIQEGTGSIGDRAIGVIAIVVMIWWSKEFKRTLAILQIENKFLKIYVDEVNGVFESLKPGTLFENGTLRFDLHKYEVDKNKSPDVVTMEVVRDIANSIDGMIVMTVYAPSNHEDKKVPMLDVKVWLNDEDNKKNNLSVLREANQIKICNIQKFCNANVPKIRVS